MFYDNFTNLCAQRGVSPSKVLDSLEISRGSLGRWKSGGEPRNEYKKKIADYFEITVEELITGIAKEKAALISEDGLSEDMKFLLSMYRSVPADRKAEALAKIATDLKNAGLID